MDKLFYPESIVILGLSKKTSNVPRIILENLIRWGYMGRIYGVNSRSSDIHVDGVKMYKSIEELPATPDLCVALIPASLVPDAIESCGRKGIRYMAIPSGGFNESGEEGEVLARTALENAGKYNIRFIGPNGLTVANTVHLKPLLRPRTGSGTLLS